MTVSSLIVDEAKRSDNAMARRRRQADERDSEANPLADPSSSSRAASEGEHDPNDRRPFVEFRKVHVDFGRQKVLRDINLTIPRGQTVALIGESGCGKTVLLKTVISLVKPTSGDSLFDGKDLARLGERALTEQRIRFGFLFQNAALFDSMTVGQNVAFPLRQHRHLSQREIERLVLERLAEVGLPDSVVSKKPAELSGGMRKARRSGASIDPVAGTDALRRTDHGPRSDHERRD